MKKFIFLTMFLPLLAYGQDKVTVSCKVLSPADAITKELPEEVTLIKDGISNYYGYIEVYRNKGKNKYTDVFGIKIKFLNSYKNDKKIRIDTPNGVKLTLVNESNDEVKDVIILEDYSKSEAILSYPDNTTDPNVVPKVQIQCLFKTDY